MVEQPTQSTAATRTAIIAFMLPPVGGVLPPLGPLLPQDSDFHGRDNPTLPAFYRAQLGRQQLHGLRPRESVLHLGQVLSPDARRHQWCWSKRGTPRSSEMASVRHSV